MPQLNHAILLLSYFVYSTIAQDDASPTDTADANTLGASGSSSSGINLTTGDQVVIIVIVAIAAVIAIASGILFYLAKKRQWEIRASIRRSARRLTSSVRPKTPATPHHPSQKDSRKRPGTIRIDPPSSKHGLQTDPDLEKGSMKFGTETTVEAMKSSFDMDSPKGWRKMLPSGLRH